MKNEQLAAQASPLDDWLQSHKTEVDNFFSSSNRALNQSMLKHRGKRNFHRNVKKDMEEFDKKTIASSSGLASQ